MRPVGALPAVGLVTAAGGAAYGLGKLENAESDPDSQ